MQTVIELVNNYGYIILFCALVLELIAFPIPGEPMMTYCGFLVYQGKMNLIISILTAASGVSLGITLSYIAGITLGESFFKKYGSYIHLDPKRLEKASLWFNAYGAKLILLAYFIPGIRHITGYFSGITKISYKKFALNAYLGALIWASTFIALGNFLGLNWYKLHSYLKEFTFICISLAAIIIVIFYIYNKRKISVTELTNKAILSFSSIGKVKIAVVSITVILLGFVVFFNF